VSHARAEAPFAAFDFASRPVVAVAVSGGSDSTAALLLLHEHLREIGASTHIIVLTVDHALRPGSRHEALQVAEFCARLGLTHRILTWSGDKPETGRLAAAREARHDLLAAAAGEAGADIVVTGHTLDDQIETVAMRRARGSGIGLAGMAPVTLFEGGTWIARPLLTARRQALRAVLHDRGIGWIDDPTNTDLRYERPRIRAAVELQATTDDRGAADAIAAAGEERSQLCGAAAELVATHARRPIPGLIHLAPAFLDEGDEASRVHALRSLLAVAGGTTHLPDEDRSIDLLEHLTRGPCRTTLSRALVASRRDGVWMCRETRDLPEPTLAVDGMIWDGRFRVRRASGSCAATIQASGPSDASLEADGPDAPRDLARAAAAAIPRLEGNPGTSVTPVAAPWARYLPGFDLPLAGAVSRLIGAAAIPSAPWRGHIVTRA
jgi:tRNA(Ile)-lysidine synthase